MCLIDHAPETRKDKTYGPRAVLPTHRPRCPGTGQRQQTSPTPSRTPALPLHRPQRALNKGLRHPGQPQRSAPAPGSAGERRQRRDPHLHGLRRLPEQATCLCLLQGLRASHPQRALGSELGESRAGFLRNPTGEEPRQLWLCGGCSAAVQMETAARISGGTSRNTSAASLL